MQLVQLYKSTLFKQWYTPYLFFKQVMSIQVLQKNSLVNEVIQVNIRGLQRQQKITLLTSITETPKIVFMSNGFYEADDNGHIDLSKAVSLGGTYKGINPMGFLASMVPALHCDLGTRLNKKDVTTPHEVVIRIIDGHKTLGDVSDPFILAGDKSPSDCTGPSILDDHKSLGGGTDTSILDGGHKSSNDGSEPSVLAKTTIYRWYMSSSVKRLEICEGGIRGTLFLPSDSGKYPGVIDLYGSSGKIKETRAALLASRGFTTLALPYFKYADLPESIADLNFSYFKKAAEWLAGHSNVRGEKGIGVIGISYGAELAHAMALYCDNVKCIVNINGNPFITLTDLYEDKQLLFKCVPIEGSQLQQTDEGIILKYGFPHSPEDYFPLWTKDVQVLGIVGDDDQQNNADTLSSFPLCYPTDKRKNVTVLKYQGAGHLIEPPNTPLCRSSVAANFGGHLCLNGGRNPEHSLAQEQAWTEIQKFLRHNLCPTTSLL